MKFPVLLIFSAALAWSASGGEWARRVMFKEKYHLWAAAIYAKPHVLLSSHSHTYTDQPEFAEIVKLGKDAIPAIAAEMQQDSDFSLFLGEAILQIMEWKRSDFDARSLQDLNKMRLAEEKLLPQTPAAGG